MDEAAYDDALIDEFDAPALAIASPQRPLLSAQSLRHCAPPPPSAAAAVAADKCASYDRERQQQTEPPVLSQASASALYPSFAALVSASAIAPAAERTMAASAPPSAVAAAPLVPRYEHLLRSESMQTSPASASTYAPLLHRLDSHSQSTQSTQSTQPTHAVPLTKSTPPRVTQPADAQPSRPSSDAPQQQIALEPAQEPRPVPILSQRELDAKQRELERELAGYSQQLDYLALALAGDTPHQIAERKRRERERHERELQRAVATELRVAHQLERLHEREERRDRVLTRGARASRSPSPNERDDVDDDANDGNTRDEQTRAATDTAVGDTVQ